MRTTKLLAGLALAGACSSWQAQATAITSVPSLPADFTQFFAAARVAPTNWDIALWNEGAPTPVDQKEVYGNGNPGTSAGTLTSDFLFNYNAGTATFTLGGQTVTGAFAPVNDFYLRLSPHDAGSSVTLSNLLVDGVAPTPDGVGAVGPLSEDLYHISGQPDGPFSLAGTVTYAWDGTVPQNDHVAFYVKAGELPPVPEPGTLALVGLGLAGAGLAARRKLG